MKPCPFCGGNRATVRWHDRFPPTPPDTDPALGWQAWLVTCDGCSGAGPWQKSESAAVGAWDRRVTPDAVADEVERLRAEVEALRASQDDAVEAAVAKERADVVAFLRVADSGERGLAYRHARRRWQHSEDALREVAKQIEAGNHARLGGGEG